MSKKKDTPTERKNLPENAGSGLEEARKTEKASKKEASYPGDSENAAGTDNSEKGDFNKIGSPPVSNDSVNSGNEE